MYPPGYAIYIALEGLMYLLYCDETNFAKTSGDFFVYGGVVIDPAHAADLAKEIEGTQCFA